jgi:homospermidine synthase
MSESHTKYTTFNKHLWIIGFGGVARGTIPLLFRHINITIEQITVIAADPDLSGCAEEYNLNFNLIKLNRDNFKQHIKLQEGDFLLNVALDVDGIDLMKWASDCNALYLDTATEPWESPDTDVSPSERTVYCGRVESLEVREYQKKIGKKPTCITSHGANPGIVSHFVKMALLQIARDTNVDVSKMPSNKTEWASLCQTLGVKIIHIAERDSQVTFKPRPNGELHSTWSVEGYFCESIQPAELSWGSHEKTFPRDGHKHEFGDAGIYLEGKSHMVNVRSWTPSFGAYQGYLIPHNEAMTIGEYFSVKNDNGELVYRPTCHFAYQPCDNAILSMSEVQGKNYNLEKFKIHLLSRDEISDGMDELGVLVAGHQKNAIWWGSQLSIHEAKKISPYNTATTLQVVCGVIGGMVYAIEHPNEGFIESEEMDHTKVMEVISPYLGKLGGHYTEWNPLVDRGQYCDEQIIDREDPWQFCNIRYLNKI